MTSVVPQATEKTNPANAPARRVTEASRIPMSVPQLRLEVPEIPGYHLHWFLDRSLPRALRAGYSFVEDDEVDINNHGLANDSAESGNTSLDSRVSVVAGGVVEGSSDAQRLHLMKLPIEWWNADREKLEARNEEVARAIRGGTTTGPNAPLETGEDRGQKYLKKGQDLFYPKHQRKR